MICNECNVRNFVHADLYCHGCDHRPKPRVKAGRAYLFLKNVSTPVFSGEVEAPEGLEYETAAVDLISNFYIEFIEDNGSFKDKIKELKES